MTKDSKMNHFKRGYAMKDGPAKGKMVNVDCLWNGSEYQPPEQITVTSRQMEQVTGDSITEEVETVTPHTYNRHPITKGNKTWYEFWHSDTTKEEVYNPSTATRARLKGSTELINAIIMLDGIVSRLSTDHAHVTEIHVTPSAADKITELLNLLMVKPRHDHNDIKSVGLVGTIAGVDIYVDRFTKPKGKTKQTEDRIAKEKKGE